MASPRVGIQKKIAAKTLALFVAAGLLSARSLRAQELAKHWDWDYKTEVVVYVDDKPAANMEVRLSINDVWADGRDKSKGARDLTKRYRTDADGKVEIPHSAKGQGRVFIQDEWSPHGTEGAVPCRFVIHLSTDDPRQTGMLDKWQRLQTEAPADTNAANQAASSVRVIGPEPTVAASTPTSTNASGKATKATAKKEKAEKP